MFRIMFIVGLAIFFLTGCGVSVQEPGEVQAQEVEATATVQPTATAEPTATIIVDPPVTAKRYPLDPQQEMGVLPEGVMGYYEPDGQIHGILAAGEPYHVIGRRGNSWLYIRLPYVGQFWIVRAQLPKADASWAPDL